MGVGIASGAPRTGIVFTGQNEMGVRLGILEKAFPVLFSEVLAEEGQDVLDVAQDRFVPVETEALKDSGELILTPFKGGAYFVHVQFGNTSETEAYAVAVHEHPSFASSPPSWHPLGKVINWSKTGTGPKYLEKPIRLARKKMPFRVAMKVQTRMPFIPGGFVRI